MRENALRKGEIRHGLCLAQSGQSGVGEGSPGPLPVAALVRRDKATRREAAVCSAASAASCSLALCLVVFYLGHLADSRDWSALLDTAGAFRLCTGGFSWGLCC